GKTLQITLHFKCFFGVGCQYPFTYGMFLLMAHMVVTYQVNLTILRLALGALSAQSKAESPGFAGAFSLLFLHRHFRMEFDLR
ncbi:hypothetical protein CWN38_11640, partial [Klebsiella pneumoniae]|uniref:hypothetical protein n=1 Tax=Klebsiella pneumoniae TaxID=573 RepID=UPI000CAA6312